MDNKIIKQLSSIGKGSSVPPEERLLKDFYPDLITTKPLKISIVDEDNTEIFHQFYLEEPLPALKVTFQKPQKVAVYEVLERNVSPVKEIEKYSRFVEATEDELDQRVEYDMDEQDREWLDDFNKRMAKLAHKPCSMDLFEYMMDQFEKEWFNLIKDVPKEAHVEIQYPEETTCAVCDDGEAENSNAIVFCDGCNLAVHQDCYGVPFIPEGQWLCRRCMIAPGRPVSCVLCPSKEGAFKQTSTNKWCHLMCAIWIPECHVQNAVYMEPIEGIKDIPKNRWKLICYICQKKHGAPIQCSTKNCFTAFHPTCARTAKLQMKMRGLEMGDSSHFKAYCDKHCSKEYRDSIDIDFFLSKAQQELSIVHNVNIVEDEQQEDVEQSGTGISLKTNRKQVSLTHPLIPQYVLTRLSQDSNEIMPKKRTDLITSIAKYWALKKEFRRGAALNKRLHLEVNIIFTKPWTAFASASKEEDEQNAQKYEIISALRRDLEKVRLILDILRKRERYKLRSYKTFLEIFEFSVFPLERILHHTLSKVSLMDKHGFFQEPVDKELVPDYYTFITQPMDFKTMKTKLLNHEYQSFNQFQHDIELIINNCKSYNRPETIYCKSIKKLEIAYQLILPDILKQIEASGLTVDGKYKNGIPLALIEEFENFKFLNIEGR